MCGSRPRWNHEVVTRSGPSSPLTGPALLALAPSPAQAGTCVYSRTQHRHVRAHSEGERQGTPHLATSSSGGCGSPSVGRGSAGIWQCGVSSSGLGMRAGQPQRSVRPLITFQSEGVHRCPRAAGRTRGPGSPRPRWVVLGVRSPAWAPGWDTWFPPTFLVAPPQAEVGSSGGARCSPEA